MSPTSHASVRPERQTGEYNGEGSRLAASRGQGAQPTTPNPNDRRGENGEGMPHQRQQNKQNKPENQQSNEQNTNKNKEVNWTNQTPTVSENANPRNRNIPEANDEQQEDERRTENHQGKERKRKKKKKSERASIKIASLNLNGKGTLANDRTDNKWLHLNQVMREEKIGILAIQPESMVYHTNSGNP